MDRKLETGKARAEMNSAIVQDTSESFSGVTPYGEKVTIGVSIIQTGEDEFIQEPNPEDIRKVAEMIRIERKGGIF